MSFPEDNISLLGVLHSTQVAPLGEDSGQLVPGFLWTSPHVPFSFADFAS